MNNKAKKIIALSLVFFSVNLIAKDNVENPNATSVVNTKVASGCNPSTSQTDLDVNNIRTTIMGGGDMWWNLSDAQYEIPKGSNKHSMFAGALWIGGVDDGGQLKVAAMTYRQSGNDFWPGPLNTSNATISAEECNKWDKHFKLERSDVEEYVANFGDPAYVIPTSILEWPAAGDPTQGQDQFLAPFFDVNENGIYEPYDGDYPDYNITGTNDNAKLYGDQTLFWIFNDKGNIHTETEAEPLGIEIHAQAFGFESDDELNDMTFYNYKIINRSTLSLNDTYFGQWVDPDLGYYLDDYVGCDVGKGLGYCYNGDAEDEGGAGYGFNPPAIGVDFFQGPLADPGDGIDNDRDNIIDEAGEQIIMSKFVYYNNDFTVTGNPESGTDIYNYLRGIWKDNVPMTYGGDGHGGGNGSTTELCNYMFPGTTDTSFAQEWTEVTAGNIPADRRFLQSAGAFTLEPGAVNTITTGVIWARAKSGGQTASVNLLKVYDSAAQELFDANFNVLNGPDAPDLNIRELDKELIFTLSNGPTSNNVDQTYTEFNPGSIGDPDSLYAFQGYLVFQLKDATVSVTDLDDPDKARLIYRSDIKDDVTGIINRYFDVDLGFFIPVQEIAPELSDGVIGSVDQGIESSFKITEDRFALGNTRLVNHKTYYFMSLAYAYNQAEEVIESNDYLPYKAGRRNIQVYSAIPHFVEPENGGTELNASYGDGMRLARKEGQGNGGIALELTKSTVDSILISPDHRSLNPTYKPGEGPVSITVVDPVNIPKGSFTFKLMNPIFDLNKVISYARWELIDNETDQIIAFADDDILVGSQQYISSLGLNIHVMQTENPGADPANIPNNGLISGTIQFDDNNDRWLSGVADREDDISFFSIWGFNWIRAGSFENETNALLSDYGLLDDPNGVFEGVVVQTNTATSPFGQFEWSGGTWAPYRFASHFNDGPGISSSITNLAKLEYLNSVDVVITDKQEHWTRVCIVEAQDDPALAEGGQVKMGLRQSLAVGKDGLPDGTLDENGDTIYGMGWFPGYAIDIETGERLNMIFSEDSWQTSENGNDMLWNPTGKLTTEDFPQYDGQQFSGGSYLLGGKHFIYVVKGESWVKGTDDYINNISDCDFSPNYDEGDWIYNKLVGGTLTGKWSVFKNVTWVGAPLLAPGRELNFSNKATIKLRVTKPYKPYETVNPDQFFDKDTDLNAGSNYVVAYENASSTWGGQPVTYDGVTYQVGESFVASSTTNFTGSNKARVIEANSVNSFNPTYTFSTDSMVALTGSFDVAKDAMETIKVVPNPYYGYSSYEINQLDNRVKITNLPGEATIKIFTVAGGLVRTLRKDDGMTSIDWDLKNDFGIPIASGLYVIHVRARLWDAETNKFVEKDKVIKWFGSLRPIDLDTF